jgi:hypothetical protein
VLALQSDGRGAGSGEASESGRFAEAAVDSMDIEVDEFAVQRQVTDGNGSRLRLARVRGLNDDGLAPPERGARDRDAETTERRRVILDRMLLATMPRWAVTFPNGAHRCEGTASRRPDQTAGALVMAGRSIVEVLGPGKDGQALP